MNNTASQPLLSHDEEAPAGSASMVAIGWEAAHRSRLEMRLVYSVAEAAALLGIGRSTTHELAARGELATTRIGRRSVVTRPTLAALLGMDPPLPHERDPSRPRPAGDPSGQAQATANPSEDRQPRPRPRIGRDRSPPNTPARS